LNGESIGDSSIIIKKVNEKFHVQDMDAELTKEEKSISLAFKEMIEEHLYFVIVYIRWVVYFNVIRYDYFKELPWILRQIIPLIVRSNVVKSLHAQGMGRHTQQEVEEAGIKDLQALSDYLGNKPFFFGNRLTSIDLVMLAFVEGCADPPLECKLKTELHKMTNLIAHIGRVREQIAKK